MWEPGMANSELLATHQELKASDRAALYTSGHVPDVTGNGLGGEGDSGVGLGSGGDGGGNGESDGGGGDGGGNGESDGGDGDGDGDGASGGGGKAGDSLQTVASSCTRLPVSSASPCARITLDESDVPGCLL